MTLGGLLDDPHLHCNLENLRTLWNLVFPRLDDPGQDEEVLPKDHRTAGLLYYFSIKRGKSHLKVEVYFSVRHYGHTDLAIAIAEGLKTYFEIRGALVCSYLKALRGIARSDALESRCGVQTYLGCSFAGWELKLTPALLLRGVTYSHD